MESKHDIVKNWLPRYTGTALNRFRKHVLLTNFDNYVERFAEITGSKIEGHDKAMPTASDDHVTMINFGMGSANAATIMDLLSATRPDAVLFLGKCGGLKRKNKIGDFILPLAGVR